MPVSFGGSFNVPAGSYLGTWDADTNTPTLASSTAPGVLAGSYYIVSVAGSTTLDGVSSWTVADWVIWSGGAWQKLEGGKTAITLAVTAVAGGATGKVLYDNNGALGEYAISGTGDVAMTDSPELLTPTIASIVNVGTLTLPTDTDTLIGRDTVDTLTQKTISGADNTLSDIDNAALVNSDVTINGSTVALGDSVTVTAEASTVVVGTTAVDSGTSTKVLYNDAGTLGEYAVTGTGDVVLSDSPTLSGTVDGNLTFSGTHTLASTLTYGGETLDPSVTGTGSMVLSDAPAFTGLVELGDGGVIAPSAAPAAPASGWVLYVDTDDSDKLKAKAANGTVVTLGTP